MQGIMPLGLEGRGGILQDCGGTHDRLASRAARRQACLCPGTDAGAAIIRIPVQAGASSGQPGTGPFPTGHYGSLFEVKYN